MSGRLLQSREHYFCILKFPRQSWKKSLFQIPRSSRPCCRIISSPQNLEGTRICSCYSQCYKEVVKQHPPSIRYHFRAKLLLSMELSMDTTSPKRLKRDDTDAQFSVTDADPTAYKPTDNVGDSFPPEYWTPPAPGIDNVKAFSFAEFCAHPPFLTQSFLNFDATEFVEKFRTLNIPAAQMDDPIRSQVTGLNGAMTHSKDVELLNIRVREVMAWHRTVHAQKNYIAPVLPVVQSSGTGKTKLLFELRKSLRMEGVHCVSMLCMGKSDTLPTNWNDYYDGHYTFDQSKGNAGHRNALRSKVIEVCVKDLPITEKQQIDVVLLLDESQHLLDGDPTGYFFRVVRWMTREVPQMRPEAEGIFNHVSLTAVPTGTSSALAQYYPEDTPAATSTRFLVNKETGYKNADEKEAVPYDPFHWLRTMGCLAKENENEYSNRATEYERCIPCGRPLFEVLYQKQLLDRFEKTALDKVMLGKDLDHDNKAAISVLGTRVQMGTTSTSIISDLVSRGYAHLTGFHRQKIQDGATLTASFAFLPDPVCARLAMQLMDPASKLDRAAHEILTSAKSVASILAEGKSKAWWAMKMSDIYRTKLCRPDKGDFGEAAVALYLLFCGDELRKKANANYKTFSVTLSDWLSYLEKAAVAGSDETEESATPMHGVERTVTTEPATAEAAGESMEVEDEAPAFTINCIQFYRHSLRIEFKKYNSQEFLKWLYKSACGIYGPVNVPAFDQMLPIKWTVTKQYLPCFVSTKNYAYASPSVARGFLIASIEALVNAGVECGLFLLVIVGQDKISHNYVNVLGKENTNDLGMFQITEPKKEKAKAKAERIARNSLLEQVLSDDVTKVQQHLVPKMLCIGEGDQFDIHVAVKNAHPSNNKLSDVYECHSSLLHDNGNIHSRVTGLQTEALKFMEATRSAISRSTKASD